jgi:ATP adenylyltransferase
MEYILGSKPSGCVFCTFAVAEVADFRRHLVLVAQPEAFVCLNRYPFTSGHLLVIPRRHCAHFGDLAAHEYAALMELVRTSVERLERATRAEGVNVGFNLGSAAGGSISDHLHAHIVPRWTGDSNFMPVIAGVRVIPEYLDDAWKRLNEAFRDVPGDRATEVSSASK